MGKDSEKSSDDSGSDAESGDEEETKVIEAGKDVESSGESDGETEGKGTFINPLAAKKKSILEPESEEWSDDDSELDKTKKKKDKKSMLGKRKRGKDDVNDIQDFFKDDKFEEVPANDPETRAKQGYESMDSDDIAEVRVLAKKMLRKKGREEILDATYNRYSAHEDPETLPSWFVEDEAQHRFCERINATKEEVAMEKQALKEYNARPSKKVEQAKQRKKKRLVKAMDKIKKKAQVIADSDINEASKMRQIQKMYKKEKDKHKEEKSYVVNRTFSTSMGKKAGRNVKMVDARMRKDMRNEKRRAKKGGNRSKSKGKK
jgi:AdoMet-dependent rRNA methyltransferase SPB1